MEFSGIVSVLWHAVIQFALPTFISGYLGVLTSKLFVKDHNPKIASTWVRAVVTQLVTTVLVYGLLLLGSSRYSLWGPADAYTVYTGTALAALCNLTVSICSLVTYQSDTTRKTVLTGRDVL